MINFYYITNPFDIQEKDFKKTINLMMQIFPFDWDFINKLKLSIASSCSNGKKYSRFLLVVKIKKNIVGFCIFKIWLNYNIAILEYLGVDKNYQNKGLGSALYVYMKNFLNIRKRKCLLFNADRDTDFKNKLPTKEINRREALLEFYEKLGARPIEGIVYEHPLEITRERKNYEHPYLLMDTIFPYGKGISGKILRYIIEIEMINYYDISPINPVLLKITNSIDKNKIYKVRKKLYTYEK